MFKDLYAHIDQKDRSRKQTLHDHLYHTAVQCSSMGKDVALEKCFLRGAATRLRKNKELFSAENFDRFQ